MKILDFRLLSVAALMWLLPLCLLAKTEVVSLRTEGLVNPIGIDTTEPRFSWQTRSDKRDVMQTSYRIIVASSPEKLAKNEGDLWDSGDVGSDAQLWIPYQGKKLESNTQAYWKVRVNTNGGQSGWSEPQKFSVGLIGETRWGGRWIGLERLMPGEDRGLRTRLASRHLRKEFNLQDKPVKRATAYISGLGLYRLYINGAEVAPDEFLKPAPSDYRKTIYYNAYDVTDLMRPLTAVGVELGNGRYFPMRQNKPYKIPVFGLPKCRLNIMVEYEDGSTQRLVTDDSWKVTADGPVRSNNEYDGEEYDARMELGDWALPGYDDSAWLKAERTDIPTGTLRAQMMPSMRVIERISPVSILKHGDKTIIDFGQNMAGWVSFVPKGASGDTIRVRCAEKLASDGFLYVDNLRDALSTDTYVCSGDEKEPWHPSFVYHGFRFVEIEGMDIPDGFKIEAQAVSDPMALTGRFECSDTTLNRVMRNAYWGVMSNYKGMPVDCPQRNERQPWLGDRTVGALGESYMFDNERLYTKWMRDICEAQREDGCIPDVAPTFWNYYTDDVTWPAALPFICEMLYRQYGNDRPIRDCYPAIARWMRHIIYEYTRDGVLTKNKYGDWCMPPEKLELIHSEDPARQTDGSLIATAYTIKSLRLLADFAKKLGADADEKEWGRLADDMTDAFNRKFLTCKRGTSQAPGHPLYPDSVFYGNNTATSNILPLAFGLVSDSLRADVMGNVVENILVKNGGHVSCGVIGISWLMRTLSENGRADMAYLLATNKSYPSWGYMAENGATTIWELWNGDKAASWMNSENHVMLLGDLHTWVYEHLGGIRPAAPGFKKIILRPDFEIPDCFGADVAYKSPYGEIMSHWRKNLMRVEWDVEIPVNTTAEIYLPDGRIEHVGSGKYHFTSEITPKDKAIVNEEFLYEFASFPQCHASTIVETKKGDLVAAYFGGTHERHPDVCIWVSRKAKGDDKWSAPILAGDGVFMLGSEDAKIAKIDSATHDASLGPVKSFAAGMDGLKRKACWNPVLFEMPDGELWLFYKIGANVGDWTGWLVKSKDGGKTWGKREPLPEGFLGPVKNKPELIGDRLICPSSTEKGGWKLHFEILDLKTGEWKYVGPIAAELAPRTENPQDIKPIDCIQPSILRLSDGRLKVLMRTRNGYLAESVSGDGGDTWSNVRLTTLPNNQSGTDAVTLRDGRHLLIYNDFHTLPGTKKGPRTPLSIAVSDDGEHWRNWLVLEGSPISQYSYPAIIQGRDGTIYCVYTWRRERVKQLTIN